MFHDPTSPNTGSTLAIFSTDLTSALSQSCTVHKLLWITAINVSPLELTACLALQYFTIFIPLLVHPLNHRFYEQKFK